MASALHGSTQTNGTSDHSMPLLPRPKSFKAIRLLTDRPNKENVVNSRGRPTAPGVGSVGVKINGTLSSERTNTAKVKKRMKIGAFDIFDNPRFVSRFPSSPLIIRAPFFLLFGFNRGTQKEKG